MWTCVKRPVGFTEDAPSRERLLILQKQVLGNCFTTWNVTLTSTGDLPPDSQTDSVRKPGNENQRLLQIPLSSPFGETQLNGALLDGQQATYGIGV